MKKELYQYYELTRSLQSALEAPNQLEEALKHVIDVLSRARCADYLVVWYREPGEEALLTPNYWICPLDLSSVSFRPGEGIIGSVYTSAEMLWIPDLDDASFSDSKQELERCFSGLDLCSMVCVPLANQQGILGCMQFLNRRDSGAFLPETVDLFSTAASMLATYFDGGLSASVYPLRTAQPRIFHIEHLIKDYSDSGKTLRVLKDISLDIFTGEFVVLLGESGSGKSTLLNILGGLNQASAGSVLFRNTDLTRLTREEQINYRRKRIGFIFQNCHLMPNLTVKQNLELIARLAEHPMDTEEVLALVGLSEKAHSYPAQLSGGQQQRVAIARAFIKNPDILLADEPTAALDYATSLEILSLFESIRPRGTTLLMVTHNEEIARMADRVIRIRDGQIYEVMCNRIPAHAKDLVW